MCDELICVVAALLALCRSDHQETSRLHVARIPTRANGIHQGDLDGLDTRPSTVVWSPDGRRLLISVNQPDRPPYLANGVSGRAFPMRVGRIRRYLRGYDG